MKDSIVINMDYAGYDIIDGTPNVQRHHALVVRIAQIESRLLAIEGIIDVTDTKLNSTEENLIISSEKIPVFGGVSE